MPEYLCGRRVRALLLCPALVLCASLSCSAFAQAVSSPPTGRAHIEEVLRGLHRGQAIGQVAVSPDGKRLAWVEGAREGGAILVAPLGSLKQPQRVTAAAKPGQHCREGQIVWEPDSKALV